MTSTTRIQHRYDHRLRELVRSTGDVEYAIQRGVPRSTARGWLTATRAEVVTVDIVDMDALRLQQEVTRAAQPCPAAGRITAAAGRSVEGVWILALQHPSSRWNCEGNAAASNTEVTLRPFAAGRIAAPPIVALSISCVETGAAVRSRRHAILSTILAATTYLR